MAEAASSAEHASSANGSLRKPKPTRALPTDRIQFDRQVDILRAYALASGAENRPVRNAEVASIVKMAPTTVAMGNVFFLEVGFISKAPDGGYVPAIELVNFNRACEWNADTAGPKLAPLVERTWFAQQITQKVRLRAMSEDEAIRDLADAAGAATHHRANLRLLLDYLHKSGLIERDGGLIKPVRPVENLPAPSPSESTRGQPAVDTPGAEGFGAGADGRVQFSINLQVAMSDFAGWEPARIAAFFNGIAQILAAKGKEG